MQSYTFSFNLHHAVSINDEKLNQFNLCLSRHNYFLFE